MKKLLVGLAVILFFVGAAVEAVVFNHFFLIGGFFAFNTLVAAYAIGDMILFIFEK